MSVNIEFANICVFVIYLRRAVLEPSKNRFSFLSLMRIGLVCCAKHFELPPSGSELLKRNMRHGFADGASIFHKLFGIGCIFQYKFKFNNSPHVRTCLFQFLTLSHGCCPFVNSKNERATQRDIHYVLITQSGSVHATLVQLHGHD